MLRESSFLSFIRWSEFLWMGSRIPAQRRPLFISFLCLKTKISQFCLNLQVFLWKNIKVPRFWTFRGWQVYYENLQNYFFNFFDVEKYSPKNPFLEFWSTNCYFWNYNFWPLRYEATRRLTTWFCRIILCNFTK